MDTSADRNGKKVNAVESNMLEINTCGCAHAVAVPGWVVIQNEPAGFAYTNQIESDSTQIGYRKLRLFCITKSDPTRFVDSNKNSRIDSDSMLPGS